MRRILETEANTDLNQIKFEAKNATKNDMNDLNVNHEIKSKIIVGDTEPKEGINEAHSRWIINADFVSNLDNTDGSKQYDN